MEDRENIFDKINNKIPDSLDKLLSTCANLVTILAPIAGVIGIGVETAQSESSKVRDWKDYVIIVLAILFVLGFYKAWKQDKKHVDAVQKKESEHIRLRGKLEDFYLNERSIVTRNYYQLIHDYRNIINELENSYKNKKLTDEQLIIMVTRFLENALDGLVDTLNKMSGQEISGCVKVITGGNSNRISYDDAKVITFVRSHNVNPARRSLDQQEGDGSFLRDNTDFMEIVSEDRNIGDSVFYQPNLKEYAEQLRKIGKAYRNSNPHWEKYYIGTIVAPIRIASKKLFYLNNSSKRKSKKEKNGSVYYTLGFLCVDSLSEDAFRLEQKENYTYIVKAYAAAMFNILSKNQFYLMRLNENADGVNENTKSVK